MFRYVKMKIHITYLLCIICSNNLFAQSDSIDIYLKAFKLHFDYIKSLNRNDNKDIQTILYVEYFPVVTDNLPDSIENFKISILTDTEIKKFISLNKSIYLIRITPIDSKQDTLAISVIDFIVSSKDGFYHYLNTGGLNLQFKYDCMNSKYVVLPLK
jgi:hypothetical protein